MCSESCIPIPPCDLNSKMMTADVNKQMVSFYSFDKVIAASERTVTQKSLLKLNMLCTLDR